MRKTLYDLGLTADDFKFEVIDIGDATYPDIMYPFHPQREFTVKMNNFNFVLKSRINIEHLRDMKAAFNINIEDVIKKSLKEEAIDWYINNNQFIRKLKLQRIKDVQSG